MVLCKKNTYKVNNMTIYFQKKLHITPILLQHKVRLHHPVLMTIQLFDEWKKKNRLRNTLAICLTKNGELWL